jgi:UDP-N-acetylglucosamine 2-epimerase (non-hydrolysing)
MKRNHELKIINVVGARPNFMKIAPLMAEYKKHPEIKPILVHTGQHYDAKMSDQFFNQLEIPKPDINLEISSATHAVQAAEIMKSFEPMVLQYKPDIVLVVGDVNSTLACALVATKLGVKVAHVEAGLRSFDRQMPEEINRILTDCISDFLFVSESSGLKNLKKEAIHKEKVFFVDNVMVDTLLRNYKKAKRSTVLDDLKLDEKSYGVVTLHRPSNVDDPLVFRKLMRVFQRIGQELPIIFPVHSRTRRNMRVFGFEKKVSKKNERQSSGSNAGLRVIDPIGYLDFLKLMASAKVVFMDSGGIQEETTILKVPCLTLRENTERPVTLEAGGNKLVGSNSDNILASFKEITANAYFRYRIPRFWDGQAAGRIVRILIE